MVKLKTYYVTRDESLPVTHGWWSKLFDSIQIRQVRGHQWPEVIRIRDVITLKVCSSTTVLDA